ncbi:MAG: sn-glycerol-1-phosphate dehydrogenase [Defluviitaleaceae bacterium]|nr:sn-glycerol-1-phosphate dehydrogenase [Defluviitaleaceae bacterium]
MEIKIGNAVLNEIPAWLSNHNFKYICVVQDINTKIAAGDRVCSLLASHGIKYSVFLFEEASLHADEFAADRLMKSVCNDAFDLILGIGSGTITDICKYVGYKANLSVAVAATAPSMDGYASKGAAITIGGMKVTPQTITPDAVFCDTDVLAAAPMELIAAGFGDMLGKHTALADWRLANLLVDEHMPADLYGQMEDALNLCVDSVDGLEKRDKQAIESLTRGLVLSGRVMAAYGDSRPASGTEHHLSHYWDMRLLAEGFNTPSHGHAVGVALIEALRLYKNLPSSPAQPKPVNRRYIEKLIMDKYGANADAVLSTQNPNLPFELILSKWSRIKDIANSLPKPDDAAALLRKLGGATRPADVGISDELVKESIVLARERKKTYTVLQLYGDLGLGLGLEFI